MLYVLRNSKPKLRKAILQHCDKDLIKALSEISLNTLQGNLPLNTNSKTSLTKYKNKLRKLAQPNGSVNAKRQILVQHGGFLPALIGVVLSSVIGSLIQKSL